MSIKNQIQKTQQKRIEKIVKIQTSGTNLTVK